MDLKTIDTLCSNALNTYLFQNVWNEVVSEFRINIKPALVSQHSCVGSFSVYDGNIGLPSLGSFYIWAINAEHFNLGLKLPTQTWVDTATICNEWRTLFHMYGPNGQMFSKGSVYLYYNGNRKTIFIAAKKQMVQKIMSYSDIDRVYATVYYDSDTVNKISMVSIDTTQAKRDTEIYFEIDRLLLTCNNREQVTYFWNGYEFDPMQGWPVFKQGDFIDVIWDKNILFSFDVDIHSDNEFPVYLSKKDQTWKQLIHIPKDKNPENKVLTHNTCDFYIRKLYDKPKLGYYVHRVADRRAVSQVTHNDFGMSLFVVDDYRKALDDENVCVHVVVREHEKNNVLIRDKNYIDLLYTHDDETIVKILMGRYEPAKNLTFWKADNLEVSKYVEMMFDTPNYATTEHFKDYVEALGYYHVVNLLCRRVIDTKVTAGYNGSISFSVPLTFSSKKIVPMVYLNKKIVNMRMVTYTDNKDNTWTITIDKSIPTKIGDSITIVIFLTDSSDVFEYMPTTDNQTIEVPYANDAQVYLRVPSVSGTIYKGVSNDSTNSWKLLKPGANDYMVQTTDGKTYLKFHTQYVGETLLIFNNKCCYRQTYDLEEYTSTGKSIAIKVTTRDKTTNNTVPILNFTNQAIFINGLYLVNGVDYFINPIKDDEGNISFYELVIQSMDHFIPGESDILDVLYNVSDIEDISGGFVIDDTMRDETPVNLYFPNISLCHVAGKLEREIDYHGVYASLVPGRYKQGGIWEIQTSIPKVVKEYLDRFVTNEDRQRVIDLNKYFYEGDANIVPHILILEEKHRIYSTFINTFLYDLHQGNIALVDDPDEFRMAEQVARYAYLKKMDLCFTKKLDQRFVDFYPQYINYETTPSVKRLVDKFLAANMVHSTDTTLQVVEVENG